jgi:hypothetical protein
MESEVEQIISEIVEIMEQYRREVPSGRRAWPESIKRRVLRLRELKIRCAEISRRTGLPYYTVLEWQKIPAAFVELPVVVKSEKVSTVTVPTLGVLTLTFPSGIRIEGVGVEALKALLPSLGVRQ